MGATCDLCKRDMSAADGCLKTVFAIGKRTYERRPYEGGWGPGNRCGDCGCKVGEYHHVGCDVERCPICGGQLLGCSCVNSPSFTERIVE